MPYTRTHTRLHEANEHTDVVLRSRHSFYLLYWYKSTNTDAEGAAADAARAQ